MKLTYIIFSGTIAFAAACIWFYNQALSPEDMIQRIEDITYPTEPSIIDDEKKLTISFLGNPLYPGGKEGGFSETHLEELFNLDLKPVVLDYKAYEQRKPLMFSSGQISDVIVEIDPIYLQKDAHHGFLCPVPIRWIKKYAPTFTAQINKYSPEAWLCTDYNGKNYGLPIMFGGGKNPWISMWRKDWLKNVAISKTPDTLDEYYIALKKFRNDDPDKNGVKDTYGMSGNGSEWSMFFLEIFGAYGVTPFDWIGKNGAIEYGGLQDETIEALELLRKWYKEGLIDPEFVTDGQAKGQQIGSKFLGSQIGYINSLNKYLLYGSVFDTEKNPQCLVNLIKQRNPKAIITPGISPIGPKGKRGVRVWGRAKGGFAFGKHLRDQPEKIIRILKMLETVTKDIDLYSKINTGLEGVHWEYYNLEENAKKTNKYDWDSRPIPPFDNLKVRKRQLLGNFFMTSAHNPDYNYQMNSKDSRDFMDKYLKPEWGLSSPIGKPDIVHSSSKYMTDLRNFQLTFFIEIIIGDRPLSDFESFKSEWLRRGGQILLDEANEMHKRLATIHAELK